MLKKAKQILAWAMIIFLVLLYLSTLIFALIRSPWAVSAFRVAIASTILLPIMFYLIVFFARLITPVSSPEELMRREAGQTEKKAEESDKKEESNKDDRAF